MAAAASGGGLREKPSDMARSSSTPAFEELTTRELLSLWARTLCALHDRGVVRTFNNPTGDIAVELVAVHFGGERGSFSQAAWDVRSLLVSCCRSRPCVAPA